VGAEVALDVLLAGSGKLLVEQRVAHHVTFGVVVIVAGGTPATAVSFDIVVAGGTPATAVSFDIVVSHTPATAVSFDIVVSHTPATAVSLDIVVAGGTPATAVSLDIVVAGGTRKVDTFGLEGPLLLRHDRSPVARNSALA
jgi:hypothetical protein